MNFVAPDFRAGVAGTVRAGHGVFGAGRRCVPGTAAAHISYGLAQLTLLGAAPLTLLTYAQAPVTTMFGH